MHRLADRICSSLLLFILWGGAALAAECALPRHDNQENRNVAAGRTTVWSDGQDRFLYFETPLHTNTDGTSRSYNVSDFWGEHVALNNLCNAMTDQCAGLNATELRARRVETQRQFAAGWPDVHATRIDPDIIAFKDGKPCPPVDGFLISATALHAKVIRSCTQEDYVDALKVPALVLPKQPKFGSPTVFQTKGVKVGDLVVAIGPSGKIVYGVVGDAGPPNKLGEASIAMNGQLLGKTAPPVNYQEIKGIGAFVRRGWDVPTASILIFARTRDVEHPLITTPEIEQAAADRFAQFGGRERLEACSRQYSQLAH